MDSSRHFGRYRAPIAPLLAPREATEFGWRQFKYVYSYWMPRTRLSDAEREWGRQLAEILRKRRDVAGVSAESLAVAADVSVETVRRIERGLVPSPGFFTVAAVAQVLDLDLADLAVAAQSGGAA